MRQLFKVFRFFAYFALIAGSLFAHHGTGISYNLDAPVVTVKGTITEFAWRNPHVSIFIDVKDEKGNIVNWGLEHSPMTALAPQGYNRNTLKPGQEVTAVFHPSRSGANVGLTVKIILPDGKEILQRNQAGAPRREER